MMNRSLPWLLLASLVLAVGCSSQTTDQVHRWSKGQPDSDSLAQAVKGLEGTLVHKVEFQGHEVQRSWQRDGSFAFSQFPVHGVKGPSGDWEEISFKDSPELSLLQRLKMGRMREAGLGKQKQKFTQDYVGWKILSARVDLVRTNLHEDWQPGFVLVAFAPDETDVKAFYWDAGGRLLTSESVAHHGVEGRAEVFPGSPDLTALDWRNLPGLRGDGYLNGDRVYLVSEKPEMVFSADHQFRVAPQEPLFDDVQAYYFADRALLWFEKKMNLRLSNRLEIKVHVGHPRQTNTAFYYDHKVRLGNGDGLSYRQIPRDPTIVSHEVSHAFVQQLGGLPFQGEGGSLNEAYADYFAGDMTEQSQMGSFSYLKASARRDLRNTLKFSDLKGALYADSLVFSGALWQLREELGAEVVRPLVGLSLMYLGPLARHQDFAPVLQRVAREQLTESEVAKVDSILEARGFFVVPEAKVGE